MPSKRSANLAIANDEDKTRTLNDWRSLKLPALRLKCNQYDLSEGGNKDDIIERLLDHFEKVLQQEEDERMLELENDMHDFHDDELTDEPEEDYYPDNAGDNSTSLTDNGVSYDIDAYDFGGAEDFEETEGRTDNQSADVVGAPSANQIEA